MRKVYYIPEGIPNIKSLFPNVDFDNVKKWSVIARNAAEQTIAETRINVLGCCCNDNDKVRIHFVNDIGEIDTINFSKTQIEEEIKSDTWKKSLKFPLDKNKGGTYRTNIRAIDNYEVETRCYGEKDQKWISELARSPLTWMQINTGAGFQISDIDGTTNINNPTGPQNLIPIIISDMKFPIKKNKDRYEYIVQLKFYEANEKNTKRS